MATSCNILQLTFPKNPRFSAPPSPSPFLLPALSRRHFTTFSSAAASSPKLMRPVSGGAVDPVAAVLNPALSYANVLFFTSGYNVQIVVEENEPEEALLRRFRREVSRAGIIQECKRRRFFENLKEERKRKVREAGRRNRRRRTFGSKFGQSSQEEKSAAKKASDDVDDNWDLPEGGIPY